jgi:hypothetical protein
MVMVRDKLTFQVLFPCIHMECRLGQSSHRGYYPASGLCYLKSRVCGGPAVYVRSLPFDQYCLLISIS